jgi:hypothetical protein
LDVSIISMVCPFIGNLLFINTICSRVVLSDMKDKNYILPVEEYYDKFAQRLQQRYDRDPNGVVLQSPNALEIGDFYEGACPADVSKDR